MHRRRAGRRGDGETGMGSTAGGEGRSAWVAAVFDAQHMVSFFLFFFSDSLPFVMTSPRPDRVDVATVVLGLGVHLRVTVHLHASPRERKGRPGNASADRGPTAMTTDCGRMRMQMKDMDGGNTCVGECGGGGTSEVEAISIRAPTRWASPSMLIVPIELVLIVLIGLYLSVGEGDERARVSVRACERARGKVGTGGVQAR